MDIGCTKIGGTITHGFTWPSAHTATTVAEPNRPTPGKTRSGMGRSANARPLIKRPKGSSLPTPVVAPFATLSLEGGSLSAMPHRLRYDREQSGIHQSQLAAVPTWEAVGAPLVLVMVGTACLVQTLAFLFR
jgi:hypothetical protein